MAWNDDSWKDSYDAWKLASPDDDDECDHDDYDVDILDGRCRCACGYSWYATNEQVLAESERQREYSEWEERTSRREFWRRLTYPIRWLIHLLLEKVWSRKSHVVITDDEIPF